MSEAQGIIETSTKGKLMEYGQLVELVMEKYNYDRLGANAFLGSLFFSIAKDEQVARIVKLVEEKN